MSLHPQMIEPVPEETARVAHLVLSNENLCLQLREEIGTFYEDDQFTSLFSQRGRPAEAPWRLALVCVLQYIEGLSDRQAAEAVRCRLDWKYLLGLELTDTGFDYSILCEFRVRLVKGHVENLLLDTLLERCKVYQQYPDCCHSTEKTHKEQVFRRGAGWTCLPFFVCTV